TTPMQQSISPNDATKWAAISIRPAMSVLTSDERAIRQIASALRPPEMPPRDTASTIEGAAKVNASEPRETTLKVRISSEIPTATSTALDESRPSVARVTVAGTYGKAPTSSR